MNRSRSPSPTRAPRGKSGSTSPNLMDHTRLDLLDMAYSRGFKGISKMKKDDLVDLLENRLEMPARSPRSRSPSPRGRSPTRRLPVDVTRYSPRY